MVLLTMERKVRRNLRSVDNGITGSRPLRKITPISVKANATLVRHKASKPREGGNRQFPAAQAYYPLRYVQAFRHTSVHVGAGRAAGRAVAPGRHGRRLALHPVKAKKNFPLPRPRPRKTDKKPGIQRISAGLE